MTYWSFSKRMSSHKVKIEEGSDPDDIQELLSKVSQLRQMEDNQALHWRRLSQIKWLGEGKEVSKYYFKILKPSRKENHLSCSFWRTELKSQIQLQYWRKLHSSTRNFTQQEVSLTRPSKPDADFLHTLAPG
jgi:hypothetical protein